MNLLYPPVYKIQLGEDKIFANKASRDAYRFSFLTEHLCVGGHLHRSYDEKDVRQALWVVDDRPESMANGDLRELLLDVFMTLVFEDSDEITDEDAAVINSINAELSEQSDWYVYAR